MADLTSGGQSRPSRVGAWLLPALLGAAGALVTALIVGGLLSGRDDRPGGGPASLPPSEGDSLLDHQAASTSPRRPLADAKPGELAAPPTGGEQIAEVRPILGAQGSGATPSEQAPGKPSPEEAWRPSNDEAVATIETCIEFRQLPDRSRAGVRARAPELLRATLALFDQAAPVAPDTTRRALLTAASGYVVRYSARLEELYQRAAHESRSTDNAWVFWACARLQEEFELGLGAELRRSFASSYLSPEQGQAWEQSARDYVASVLRSAREHYGPPPEPWGESAAPKK